MPQAFHITRIWRSMAGPNCTQRAAVLRVARSGLLTMLETESARFIAHVGIDDKQAIEMTKTVANMRVLMAQSRDRGTPSPLMTLLTAGLLGELHAKSHLAGLTFKEGEK